jgi:CheY-like chemotaxis protein
VLIGEQIHLNINAAKAMPPVLADVSMMEQVLINLTVNARDAMPGGGQLSISVREELLEPAVSPANPEGRGGRFVVLCVKDTGCGMDEQTLSHLFEPFFTTKETGKGTGLGLATVYGIVKQHQGWISVNSAPGAGTAFSVYLPASTPAVQAPAPLSIAATGVAGGAEGILVVEDEAALRELVVTVLELYGYRTFQADRGSVALKTWAENKNQIDLLLTDMVMPEGMTGPQLAHRLVSERPTLKVIYTSGYSPGLLNKDVALMEGANFLPKPYKPIRLAQMIREALDKGK